MLKLGVWKRSSFVATPPSGAVARLLHRLSKSRVSLHLLSIPKDPSSQDIELFERLMPHVRLSSGVYRTTYRQRFRTLNPIVNKILVENFSPRAPLRVEDWAGSDCLTSAEWAEELFPLFTQLEFAASDLLLFLLEVQEHTSERRYIVEPDGSPLQYVRPPFVVRLSHPEPRILPISWLLARSAKRSWNELRSSLVLPKSSSPTEEAFQEQSGYQLRKLPLVHPEALRLARQNARFSVRSHSIFSKSEHICQVVRTMNIYNRAYFPEERLREGTSAVLNSLAPGGIWIVGRTADGTASPHNATIFRKQDGGLLEVVERIGQGSEIEELAISSSSRSQ